MRIRKKRKIQKEKKEDIPDAKIKQIDVNKKKSAEKKRDTQADAVLCCSRTISLLS
jgi:hypothetical protein